MTPEERAAIRDRDFTEIHAEDALGFALRDRRALLEELDRLHSWAGLMELLDEHWPDWLFVPRAAPEDYHEPLYWLRPDTRRGRGGAEVSVRADPGAIITGLIRWVDRLTGEVERWKGIAERIDHGLVTALTNNAEALVAAFDEGVGQGTDYARGAIDTITNPYTCAHCLDDPPAGHTCPRCGRTT